MKILRRPQMSGSQTPWERLSREGFTENPHGFVLMIDADGRLVTATPQWPVRFHRWWKWDVGTRWRDTVPEPGAERAWAKWLDVLRRALEVETAFQASVTLSRTKGKNVRVDFLSQPVRDGAGRVVGAILAGKFHPLVEGGRSGAKAGSRAPRASRATPVIASLWVRPKRRRGEGGLFIESLSAGARRFFGGESLLRPGDSFPECLPEEMRGDCVSLLERVAVTGEPARSNPVAAAGLGRAKVPSLELTILPASASRFCVILRRDPQWEAGRRMLVACGEQIVSLEGELRRAQRLATQGMLAAAIGHEANNCLAVALANASLFRERHAANTDAVRAIEPVMHAVETAGKICQRFLNLSGRGETAPVVVDLAETVQRSFDMLVRIVPRRITFEPKTAGPLFVRADPTHIEQIVVNLVLNARDATRDGVGKIALAAGRGEAAAPAGAGHWFEVTDDGPGIPPNVRRKLFTAFFTTKPSKRGTGLGLATVLRLTKGMGGDVKLTSEVGRGTSVRIVLPVAEGHAPVDVRPPKNH